MMIDTTQQPMDGQTMQGTDFKLTIGKNGVTMQAKTIGGNWCLCHHSPTPMSSADIGRRVSMLYGSWAATNRAYREQAEMVARHTREVSEMDAKLSFDRP